MARYFDLEEVEAIHDNIMSRFPEGPQRLRSPEALESALHRPVWLERYADADVIDQAAILMVGISQAQAFVEGNKRTAFATARAFLYLNGRYQFSCDPLMVAHELVRVAERVASGMRHEEATRRFQLWLRENVEQDIEE